MTQYIDENVFKSCITNNLANYPYFNRVGDDNVKHKAEITDDIKKANPLNFLMINDTFHDLVNPRGTYNPSVFVEGPLNYLLTGEYFTKNNVKIYEDGINFPEFQQLTGRFEPKVAKSFEINMGLQTADTFITYDDIIRYVRILRNHGIPNQITIQTPLLSKVINSNGSIAISLNSGENSTFSSYIEQQNMIDTVRNEAYLKISYFISWYLHCPNLPQQGTPDTTFQIADSTMKILFDAGSSFLKEFFSAPGSKVEPFVAIPCILDSASTSTEKLDPTLDFHFEELKAGQVVPIVSNYFSCDKYFFCYLPNTADKYDLDTLYGFSLAILKIPEATAGSSNFRIMQTINNVRNNPTPDNEDLKFIFDYINANQGIVARYYFGQVKKDSKTNDKSSCGTCGAGVPYIGRVIDKIKDLRQTTIPNPVPFSPNPPENIHGNLNTLKTELNNLKNNAAEPLGGRIPFSDTRILKIFCTADGNITISNDDLYSLFQILADYKRTGDYQQAYTLLKAILTGAKDNSEFFTFCSGDELSALIGRLLGVPTIYQTANGAQCRLYRGRLFSTNEEAKLQYELKNDKNIIQKYCGSIRGKIELLHKFIEANYEHNLILREKLRTFITSLQEEFNGPPPSLDKQMNTFFKLISVRNAYDKLNEIIELSDVLLLGNFFELPLVVDVDADAAPAPAPSDSVKQILQLCSEIKDIETGNIISKEDPRFGTIKNALVTVSKFEETINGFKIYNFIEDNFPQYFNNIKDPSKRILISYNDTENGRIIPLIGLRNLKIPHLEIDFFSSKVKSVSSLYSTYNAITVNELKNAANPSGRRADTLRDKIRLQKIEFLNVYNKFIDSCKFLIDRDNFKIQSFNEFNVEYMNTTIGVLTVQTQSVPPVLAVVPAPPPQRRPAPTEVELKVAKILLNLKSALIKVPEPENQVVEEPRGGNNEFTYNQQGGATSHENIRKILNDVKQLILNLYNKCTNYIKDVKQDSAVLEILRPLLPQPQPQIIKLLPTDFLGNPQNFLAFLRAISDIYETNEFCYQLLFQEADVEEENTIDNINIGFLTGLKLITNQYTYFDLGYTQAEQPPDITEKNISINFLLNSNIFNLSSIKIVLFLLGWSNQNYLDLIDTYFDEVEPKKNVEINNMRTQLPLDKNSLVNLISPTSLMSRLMPLQMMPLPIPEEIKSIFSIIFFSIMEYLYYGRYGEKYKFDNAYIDSLISLENGRVTSRTQAYALNVLSKINESSNSYLTITFLTYIDNIPDLMLTKLKYMPLNIRTNRVRRQTQLTEFKAKGLFGYRTTYGGNARKTIKKNKTRTN
jgi:hypothetical protein